MVSKRRYSPLDDKLQARTSDVEVKPCRSYAEINCLALRMDLRNEKYNEETLGQFSVCLVGDWSHYSY